VQATYNPETQAAEFDLSLALPFGASSSVYFFNRFSRAIWHCGVVHFGLLWTNFYDDFPHLSQECCAANALATSESFLEMIGWRFSLKPSKRKEFDASFEALGVLFDLNKCKQGTLEVGNKPSRLANILQMTKDIIASKRLPASLAAKLKGKLIYTESHIMGRLGQLAIQALSSRAHNFSACFLSDDICEDLQWVVARLSSAKPRTIHCLDTRPPVLLFTDAACEGTDYDIVTFGAILFDKTDATIEYFHDHVSNFIVSEWKQSGIRQVIGQAEIYPVVLAKRVWANRLLHRKLLVFIDNDSARLGLIKAASSSRPSRDLILLSVCADADSSTISWYARVPSVSNPADSVSRGDFAWAEGLGAVRVSCPQLSSVSAEAASARNSCVG
jgi:hypothetical protein